MLGASSLDVDEKLYWPQARHIFHFIGICGAGKSTLSSRLAKRCRRFKGKAVGTIDYDPHTPDHIRINERAFSRELDRLNMDAQFKDHNIHRQIVDHCLSMIKDWTASDANAIFVDRWYESYDQLPTHCRLEIEQAIALSGFQMQHILLLVGNSRDAIEERLLHTKDNRPGDWWAMGPETLEEWVTMETNYQREYQDFCAQSKFPTQSFDVTGMDWANIENNIISAILQK